MALLSNFTFWKLQKYSIFEKNNILACTAVDIIPNTFDIFEQRNFILTSTVMCYWGYTDTTV